MIMNLGAVLALPIALIAAVYLLFNHVNACTGVSGLLSPLAAIREAAAPVKNLSF